MSKFKYNGAYAVVYPNIIIPGKGSLSVEPGEVCELDCAPDDGQWLAADDPKPAQPIPVPATPAAAPQPASQPVKVTPNA